jgi:hypothetical protein
VVPGVGTGGRKTDEVLISEIKHCSAKMAYKVQKFVDLCYEESCVNHDTLLAEKRWKKYEPSG